VHSSWREPKAKRLEKEKKNLWVLDPKGCIRGSRRSWFTSLSVVSGSGRAGAKTGVMVWLVSLGHCSASAIAPLTVAPAVTSSLTHVVSSLLLSFMQSLIGILNVGLSHARSKSCLECSAGTRDGSLSIRLRSFSSLSHP
jgi:hypothetical protein